jgi:hypothetical protein
MPTKKTIIITSILTISLIVNLVLSFFLFQKNSDKIKDAFVDKTIDKIYYNKNNETLTLANSKDERWKERPIGKSYAEIRRQGNFLQLYKNFGQVKSEIFEITKQEIIEHSLAVEPEFYISAIKDKDDYIVESLETKYRVIRGLRNELKRDCDQAIYYKDDLLCYNNSSNAFTIKENDKPIKISDKGYSFPIDIELDKEFKNFYLLSAFSIGKGIGDVKLYLVKYNFETKESKEIEIEGDPEKLSTDKDGNVMIAISNKEKSKLITYLVKDSLEPIYESQDEVRIY